MEGPGRGGELSNPPMGRVGAAALPPRKDISMTQSVGPRGFLPISRWVGVGPSSRYLVTWRFPIFHFCGWAAPGHLVFSYLAVSDFSFLRLGGPRAPGNVRAVARIRFITPLLFLILVFVTNDHL